MVSTLACSTLGLFHYQTESSIKWARRTPNIFKIFWKMGVSPTTEVNELLNIEHQQRERILESGSTGSGSGRVNSVISYLPFHSCKYLLFFWYFQKKIAHSIYKLKMRLFLVGNISCKFCFFDCEIMLVIPNTMICAIYRGWWAQKYLQKLCSQFQILWSARSAEKDGRNFPPQFISAH